VRYLFLALLGLLCLGAAVSLSCARESNSSGSNGALDDDASPTDDDDDASPADDDDDNDDDNDDTAGETVWTDSTTALTWQNGPAVGSIQYDVTDAQLYCSGLSWGGFGGWRLPTISELRSLIRGCAATEPGGACGVTDGCLELRCLASCGGCPHSEGPAPGGFYWPSELSGNADNWWYWSDSAVAPNNLVDDAGWTVDFNLGSVSLALIDYNNAVRCVR